MRIVSKAEAFRAILRQDLTAFIEKTFRTIAPGEPYFRNWHLDAIAFRLAACRPGARTRLIITQPPRSLKSISSSVAFVAWRLGLDPSLRFICVSYSQDLSLELARQFRLVIESPWYKKTFPQMRLKRDTGAECVTTKGGGRLATSIGGTLTGRGADIILIDDPLKAEDALSETARKRVIDWYASTLSTRLNDKRKGVIILVMQRLHEEDLAGHVIAAGGWDNLDLPAIAIDDERIEIAKGVFHHRKEGEALQPDREPLAVLDRLKAEVGSLRFSAQYQQRPVPAEGNIIRRAWFQHYNAPPDSGVVCQSWDIATSVNDTGDYSVCVTARCSGGRIYILDVWRGRLAFPPLKAKIIDLSARFRPACVYLEKAGGGEHLVQEFLVGRPPGMAPVIGVRPDGDKRVRLEAVSPMIEAGDVLLPKDAPWLDVFLAELLAFPNARHDDQADAFSQLLRRRRAEPDYSYYADPMFMPCQIIELDP